MMKRLFRGMARRLRGWFQKPSRPSSPSTPYCLERREHPLSRRQFSSAALKVLYRLHHAGYESYLVGGALRDLLCHQKPKDFDVVTNATPQAIRSLFPNGRIIGRRFQLVHILFAHEVIEVSTFRKGASGPPAKGLDPKRSRWLHNNLFGRIEDDEMRRDFTVNALYYSIADFSLRDGVGALDDLKAKLIRTIGEAEARVVEDPARILRAFRLAAKLNFQLEPTLAAAIEKHKSTILNLAPERLKEEIFKIFQEPSGAQAILMMRQAGLWPLCFPQIWREPFDLRPFENLCELRIQDRPSSPSLRAPEARWMEGVLSLATLLWLPLLQFIEARDPILQPLRRGLKGRMEKIQRALELQSPLGLPLNPPFQKALWALWAWQWQKAGTNLAPTSAEAPSSHSSLAPTSAETSSLRSDPYEPWALRLASYRAQTFQSESLKAWLTARHAALQREGPQPALPPRPNRRPRRRRRGRGAEALETEN